MSATTYWTLECDGVEKTFEDWGFGQLKRNLFSQQMDTVTFNCVTDTGLTDTPVLGPGKTCIIRSGRVEGVDGALSGGQRWFYGLVLDTPKRGIGTSESLQYKIGGPWWYLDNKVYTQTWKTFWGDVIDGHPEDHPDGTLGVDWMIDTTLGVYYVYQTTTMVCLNQRIIPFYEIPLSYLKISTGQQIRDALRVAIAGNAPITIGDEFPPYDPTHNPVDNPIYSNELIDYVLAHNTGCPNVDVKIDSARDIACSELIRKQMRYSPDAVMWFDYTTEPYPTIHCKSLSDGGLTSVEVPFGPDTVPGNVAITELDVTPRYDLQVPYVQINYVYPFSANNNSWTKIYRDIAPASLPGVSPYTVDNPPANPPFTSLIATVDMQGTTSNDQTSNVTVFPNINANLENIVFWKTLHPELSVLTDLTIVHGSGTRGIGYNPLCNNLLDTDSSSLADWMNEASQKETISVVLQFVTQAGDAGRQTIFANIVSTTATTKLYSKVSYSSVAEPFPSGTAAKLYNSLQALQFAGSMTITEPEVSGLVSLGNSFNISGGDVLWASMKAMVVSLEEDVDKGETKLSFGPPGHLGTEDFVNLLRITRQTKLSWAISGRTGAPASFGSVQSGRVTPRENSISAPINRNIFVVSSGPATILRSLKKGTYGDPPPTPPDVKVSLNGTAWAYPDDAGLSAFDASNGVYVDIHAKDLGHATPEPDGVDTGAIRAYLRRVHLKDFNGDPKRCYGLFSRAEDDLESTTQISPGDDSQNDEYDDVWIAGGTGGGGGIRCTITTLYNANYLAATPVAGGSVINVAKSIPSRGGVADDNSRVVSGEAQIMIPPFVVGDTIWADVVDSTDVSVSETPLNHIEKNTQRGWCHQCGTATVSGVLVLTP